jgi:cobalt/nickel transport system permease protein
VHIPDGLLIPINPATHTINPADAAILVATWAITVPFLFYAWKKTKATYTAGLASTLAILSALIFVVQMLTFPVAGGTSVHILGGTLVVVILGPYAGMLILGMQAVIFADGGLLAFGANALNMAVIASLSFFLLKFLAGNFGNRKRFFLAVFATTLTSTVATAVFTSLEIGFSQAFVNSGGIAVTIPTMLAVYSAEGVIEATLTSGVTTGLMAAMPRFHQTALAGLNMLQRKEFP